MLNTYEAVIDDEGAARLLEAAELPPGSRALVVVLQDDVTASETALLSEAALAEDWNRPEEDEAWSQLQPVESS